MRTTEAELLFRIVQSTFDAGDDALAETRQKLAAHARRILDDEELLIRAWEVNQRDKERFVQHMPIVQAKAQAALGSTLQQQRTALAPVKKAENG